MTRVPVDERRRQVLQAVTGVAVGVLPMDGASPRGLVAPPAPPPGRPGEFDFLAGSWSIHHRRRRPAGGPGWDEFEGEATCWTILGGVGSVEELRIPARGFSGLGLRLLDVERRVWSDFWVDAKSGVLGCPGTTGGFVDGVGTFIADDIDGTQPVRVRGVWDRITASSCRWSQALSRDGGKTWVEDWLMDWTKRR